MRSDPGLLKMGVNIAVFGAFVLMVAVLGFFLWQTLFVFEKHSNTQPEAKPSYSDQRAGDENSVGLSLRQAEAMLPTKP